MMLKKIKVFAAATVQEVRKVVWPERSDAIQATLAVAGLLVTTALILWGFDKSLEFFIYNLLLNWKH
jgi:preprotein translocase subunit SecE